MKVTVEQTSPSRRVLTISVPADKVEEAYKRAFNERRKSLKLKGFRKGNVPVKIAKKHITDGHLVHQVVNLLVPPAYAPRCGCTRGLAAPCENEGIRNVL